MAFVFNFPDVGEGIHEGRVVEWLVAEGDVVAEDQALVKVETDKAVVELPSPYSGTVLRLHAAADSEIFVGDPLVTIGEAGEELPEDFAPAAEAAPATAPVPPPADVEAPVQRVAGFDVVFPLAHNEKFYLPSRDRIVKAVEKVLAY